MVTCAEAPNTNSLQDPIPVSLHRIDPHTQRLRRANLPRTASFRVVHKATFIEQCERFWNTISGSPTHLTRKQLGFTSLYMSCLVASIRMLDAPRLQALPGYDRETAERFALHWHQVGHDAREASDWMQYHNVNVLQGIM
jgi:hypothetical protein